MDRSVRPYPQKEHGQAEVGGLQMMDRARNVVDTIGLTVSARCFKSIGLEAIRLEHTTLHCEATQRQETLKVELQGWPLLRPRNNLEFRSPH